MKTLITSRSPTIYLAIACLSLCQAATAQDATERPHWNANTCGTCHEGGQPTPGNLGLAHDSTEALCESCHGDRGDAFPCRHSSDIPSAAFDIPEGLAGHLKDGQIVCSTCHDVVYQCERPRASFSFQNRGFLRDRTARKTGDYCIKCHDAEAYQKLNPHTGVTGSPPRPTCQLCHAGVPGAGAEGELQVEFNMQQDLNEACTGCHTVRPHPKSMSFGLAPQEPEWIHLALPSADVLAKMSKSFEATGVGLPLNPINGEVFCATCHNPHDFKIGGEHGSSHREAKHRLRMPNICQACHDK